MGGIVDKVLKLWAKLGQPGEDAVHPLICHLLDVGTVADALVRHHMSPSTQRWLADGVGVSVEVLPSWMGFIASLHDIGKATPAFQAYSHRYDRDIFAGLGAAGFSFERIYLADLGSLPRHDILSKAVLPRLLHEQPTASIPRSVAADLARVAGGHHGVFHPHNQNRIGEACGHGQWLEARTFLVTKLAEHWHVSRLPLSVMPRPSAKALVLLSGLVTVADWIASCETFFPYAGTSLDLDAYIEGLPELAADALDKAGWQQIPAASQGRFEAVFDFPPNELQQHVEESARSMTHPGLMLIEAPTGIGKTEAAYRAEQILSSTAGHDGIYVALPTQATSNQAWKRLGEYLRASRADGIVPPRLLHSGAMLYEHGVGEDQEDESPLPTGIGADSDEGLLDAQEWFAASKRGLLAATAAGTIDQALMAVLHTRHFFVRLFGLAGKVVILDEVHAYDTFTSTHLQRLLEWLGRMNCSVILLSATLPTERRKALIEAYTGSQTAVLPAVPYPRLTVADGSCMRCEHLVAADARTVSIEWKQDNPPGWQEALVAAMSGGGCAAVICNTVRKAQETYSELRSQCGNDTEMWLLHSRFPFARRQEIEKEIVSRLGKDGRRSGGRPQRAIVVATQIIEQSLDLDFDLMVSELAPIDLLLQRAGRLHRHVKADGILSERPERLREPTLWILQPPNNDGVPDFGSSSSVYEEYVLLRSLAVLQDRKAWSVPDDLDALIESVYGDLDIDALPGPWRAAVLEAKAAMEHADTKDAWEARCGEVLPPEQARELLKGNGVATTTGMNVEDDLPFIPQTRKAYTSVRCICLCDDDGQLKLPTGQAVYLDDKPSTKESRKLLRQSVTMPAWAVRADGHGVPAGWRKSPMLRRFRPLVFFDGIEADGRLRLDDELGIVIEANGIQED
jgi:CRISPR-associated endonuclease/helicase Cas3